VCVCEREREREEKDPLTGGHSLRVAAAPSIRNQGIQAKALISGGNLGGMKYRRIPTSP